MKQLAVFFALVLCNGVAFAKAPVETYIKTVPAFQEIYLDVNAEIEIIQGTAGKLEITSDSFLYQFLTVQVADGKLYLGLKKLPEGMEADGSMKIKIHVAELEALIVEGSSTVTNAGTLDVKKIRINVMRNGQVNLALNADKVDTFIRKDGSVRLTGTVAVAKVRNKNGGSYDDRELSAAASVATEAKG